MNRAGLLFLSMAAFAAAGCSRGGSNERAWEYSLDLPPGSVVHIRNGVGDITVRQAPSGGPHAATLTAGVAWRRGRAKDVHFDVTHDGNAYYVCAMWRGSGTCGANGYHGRKTALSLLEMFALFHRSSDVTADLVAQLPAGVIVDALTTSGSVDIEGVSSGVTARTTNGTVTASHVSGPTVLRTVNGNVRLSLDAASAGDSIHLQTQNGMIKAELPPGIDGIFDLSVTNGAVRTDLPFNNQKADRSGRRLRGQIGASSRVVRMRTTNGSLSVTTRGASTSH